MFFIAPVLITVAEAVAIGISSFIGGGAITFGVYKGVTMYQESKHKDLLLLQRDMLAQRGQEFTESGNSLQNRTNNLTIELERLNGSAGSSQESYNRLQRLINELRDEVGPRLSDIQHLNDETRAYRIIVTDILDEVGPSIEALIQKNNALVKQLTELDARLGENSALISRLKKELAEAKSRIVVLEQTNNNLSSVVTEQNTVLQSQSEQIDSLRTSTSALVSQIGIFRELSGQRLNQEPTTENNPKL